jgi:hypothetical protein
MRMIFAGYVAQRGEENACRVLVGRPEGPFSLKTYGVDGKIN